METIKVIELLNKIANGEEVPKKIKFDEHIYKYVNRTDELYNYKREDGKYLEEVWMLTNILNSEVEIIEDTPKEEYFRTFVKKLGLMPEQRGITPKEDKKIEYIDYLVFNDFSNENKVWYLENKINEIIEKVNGE